MESTYLETILQFIGDDISLGNLSNFFSNKILFAFVYISFVLYDVFSLISKSNPFGMGDVLDILIINLVKPFNTIANKLLLVAAKITVIVDNDYYIKMIAYLNDKVKLKK